MNALKNENSRRISNVVRCSSINALLPAAAPAMQNMSQRCMRCMDKRCQCSGPALPVPLIPTAIPAQMHVSVDSVAPVAYERMASADQPHD
eukprot:2175516-Amphidinium_carterae.1